MKYKNCPGYDADTENIKIEIGSANGVKLYREKTLILSERCSAKNIMDDFDCSKCPIYLNDMKKQENETQ